MSQTVLERDREGLDIVMWFVSTAGVGRRHFKPATPVRCTLLRKPTKEMNCNGRYGGLSTAMGLRPSLLPEDQSAGTGWNDKDFQILILRKLGRGLLCRRMVGKETEHRRAAA